MSDIKLNHLLDVAICAAEAAGNHALQNKARRKESAETFTHDIKLILDMECQKIAEGVIAGEYPEHGILGEEGSTSTSNSDYEWVIDPIDGTMNYTNGFPYWCCSVAIRLHDKVLAGCVYAPELGDYYTAHIEDIAKKNGEPISISDTNHLQDAFIFTGLSKELDTSRDHHFELFRMLALNTKKVRIAGAAALDLCHVAAGSGDGFFETGLFLWDYAAAGLIAEQAGATLSIFPQKNIPHGATILCSNEYLIDGLRAIHTKCI